MNNITEITRRDIFDLFTYGIEHDELWDASTHRYYYWGRLQEIDFLSRIYDLKSLPSYDDRFPDAAGDIRQHTVNNDDFELGWVFTDERFQLLTGTDATFLRFLCEVFHPAVRYEKGYWEEFLEAVNNLLRNDGYELYPAETISGRDVYEWRKYDSDEVALFIPFSQRNLSAIQGKKLKLTISKKARIQIFKLMQEHSQVFWERDETGWESKYTTDQYVLRDISFFYEPKCFQENGEYLSTDNLEDFIMSNSPFYVFDAIEIYAKYSDEKFPRQINQVLKLNAILYKLENGKIVNTLDAKIENAVVQNIDETGLQELIKEAVQYYNENNKQVAVEKLWDAFERLKTYYSPKLNKAESADKLVRAMSDGVSEFYDMYNEEFKVLRNIGNNFRIRHHETTKVDITDDRQYDYFYKRCLALISTAVQYLEKRI